MTERGSWGHKLHFLATCVGFATGLGNLWRFPALAYENGGGAFLIPYIIVSIVIGFPLLYLEMSIGQFARVGPARCFQYFKPAFQGIGWASIIVAYVVGIYYNMINVYSAIYLKQIISGNANEWMQCDNGWNTQYCQSGYEDERCISSSNGNLSYYFNRTCWNEAERSVRNEKVQNRSALPPVSSAEEFFELFVHEKGDGLTDDRINWQLLIGFALIWIVTAITLVKGVAWIGRISTITATLPYLIITCIFFRAITLDGAEIGLDFFLFKPDMSYLFMLNTWMQAAIQICYTLGIGFGGLLSLSSYNEEQHNCFKDAIIVVSFDSFMSIFGGSAAFATMGFLAKQSGLPLSQVVQSGTTLTFVAYPEAMMRMPLPYVWALAFFTMFFLLGVSSQFGMTEVMISGLADQFPFLHSHKGKLSILVCLTSFLLGLPMCTKGGIYWFTLMNEYCGTFALFAIAFFEVLLIGQLYGVKEYQVDLRWMMGLPRSIFGKLFGAAGVAILFNWAFVAPIVLLVLFSFALYSYFDFTVTYGKSPRIYTYPEWASMLGWIMAIIPLLPIPLFALINVFNYSRRKGSWREAFRVQPKLRSYDRIRGVVAKRNSMSDQDKNLRMTTRSGRIVPVE
ncbi:hypothetical protein PENTCL1PPCAC_28054 [Pristionchus entomophagus]|uniref:Transporter n=1 Tax=Pristionchus entomophagus TaxID=358040 RepID=A0AAV5UJ45_9BILA|nr:hypothetical protein PENTCL1PPCAC_28054 [Pristionchus entomophagus]